MHLKLFPLFLVLSFSMALTAQQLTEDKLVFLHEHTHQVSNGESKSTYDWGEVLQAIDDRSLVLLGEFTHGAREVFITRNDLIETLHEKLGFNVVLFESGLGEVMYYDLQQEELSADHLVGGFIGPWRTKEFVELMEYFKKEEIAMSGFDVQRSGQAFAQVLCRLARQMPLDSNYCVNLEARFGQLRRPLANWRVALDSIEESSLQLINDYEQLYQQMLAVEPNGLAIKTLLLSMQTLRNRIAFLHYMLQFKRSMNWNERWAARDSLMAENIRWLKEHIYPEEKIIVIGHNYHIARFNATERTMGAFLQAVYQDDMFVIGTFADSGQMLNNAGQPEQLSPPDATEPDLKHYIQALGPGAHFIKIPDTLQVGSEWLWEPIIVNDTFIDLSNRNMMRLSKHFDALLLLDWVSLPLKP